MDYNNAFGNEYLFIQQMNTWDIYFFLEGIAKGSKVDAVRNMPPSANVKNLIFCRLLR